MQRSTVDAYRALETLEAMLPTLERDDDVVDRVKALAENLAKQPKGKADSPEYTKWASGFAKTTGGEKPMDIIVHNPDPSEHPEAKPTVDKVPSQTRQQREATDKVGEDRAQPLQTHGPRQPAQGTKQMHSTLSGRMVDVGPGAAKATHRASRPSMNKGPKR